MAAILYKQLNVSILYDRISVFRHFFNRGRFLCAQKSELFLCMISKKERFFLIEWRRFTMPFLYCQDVLSICKK